MNSIDIQHQQHTPAWYRARLGKITGSRVGDIMGREHDAAFSKTGLSYLISVAAERMIPQYIIGDDDMLEAYLDEVSCTTRAMRIGTEREAEARELYAELTGRRVAQVGSIAHPTLPGFASSPDGLVDDGNSSQGTLEIKCPKPSTYLEYLTGIHCPADLLKINAVYYWQCMAHMAVTGSSWTDFVAYCPYNRRPLHIVRINRDADAIADLERRIALAEEYIAGITQPTPAQQNTTNTTTDMQTIGSVNLSDADYEFLVDGLARLLPHHPTAQTDDYNFVRRMRLLLEKLDARRPSKKNNQTTNNQTKN